MKKKLIIITIILVFGHGCNSRAQEPSFEEILQRVQDFQGIRPGMTVEEVNSRLWKPCADLQPLSDAVFKKEVLECKIMEKYPATNRYQKVSLYFDKKTGKLFLFMWQVKTKSEANCQEARKMIISKYGKPDHTCDYETKQGILMHTSYWGYKPSACRNNTFRTPYL